MRKAFLQMHIAIFLWGFTGIFGRAIHMTEEWIVWYRMLLTALSILAILLWQKKISLPSAKEMLVIFFTGALVCLHWITFYASIKASNVSIALSCFASVALFTAIQKPLFYKHAIKWSEIFFGVFVIAGIYIIFTFQKVYALGIVFAVISASLASWFTIINERLLERHDAMLITFYEMLSGFFLLCILLPFYMQYRESGFSFPSGKDLLWLILLSLVCTTLAFTLGLVALKHIDAFTMNLSVNLEPVYSIILAIIIFNEGSELNAGFYFGTMIILASVVLHSWLQYRKRSLKNAASDGKEMPLH